MAERVIRAGETVRRPLYSWSASVHRLLRFLESVDFPAPRVLGVQGDQEIVSWIEGDSGSAGWANVIPESGLKSWGRFLRNYHDVVQDYMPPAGSSWSSGVGSCEPGEIVCHGDFGPWNAVWRDGLPVALLDWDHARPAPPLFDVTYGLEYVAPFRTDLECISNLRYASPPNRRRRIEIFCEAYGISVPLDVVGCVARQQRETAQTVERLASLGIEPQATWVRKGYLTELLEQVSFTESIKL